MKNFTIKKVSQNLFVLLLAISLLLSQFVFTQGQNFAKVNTTAQAEESDDTTIEQTFTFKDASGNLMPINENGYVDIVGDDIGWGKQKFVYIEENLYNKQYVDENGVLIFKIDIEFLSNPGFLSDGVDGHFAFTLSDKKIETASDLAYPQAGATHIIGHNFRPISESSFQSVFFEENWTNRATMVANDFKYATSMHVEIDDYETKYFVNGTQIGSTTEKCLDDFAENADDPNQGLYFYLGILSNSSTTDKEWHAQVLDVANDGTKSNFQDAYIKDVETVGDFTFKEGAKYAENNGDMVLKQGSMVSTQTYNLSKGVYVEFEMQDVPLWQDTIVDPLTMVTFMFKDNKNVISKHSGNGFVFDYQAITPSSSDRAIKSEASLSLSAQNTSYPYKLLQSKAGALNTKNYFAVFEYLGVYYAVYNGQVQSFYADANIMRMDKTGLSSANFIVTALSSNCEDWGVKINEVRQLNTGEDITLLGGATSEKLQDGSVKVSETGVIDGGISNSIYMHDEVLSIKNSLELSLAIDRVAEYSKIEGVSGGIDFVLSTRQGDTGSKDVNSIIINARVKNNKQLLLNIKVGSVETNDILVDRENVKLHVGFDANGEALVNIAGKTVATGNIMKNNYLLGKCYLTVKTNTTSSSVENWEYTLKATSFETGIEKVIEEETSVSTREGCGGAVSPITFAGALLMLACVLVIKANRSKVKN